MLGPLEVLKLDQPIVISLEDLVPRDHFYRRWNGSLDLTVMCDLVKECCSPMDRPSIDPVVFVRLQLVMYFEGLRFERQLMRFAADRLSIRWYRGYDLHEYDLKEHLEALLMDGLTRRSHPRAKRSIRRRSYSKSISWRSPAGKDTTSLSSASRKISIWRRSVENARMYTREKAKSPFNHGSSAASRRLSRSSAMRSWRTQNEVSAS